MCYPKDQAENQQETKQKTEGCKHASERENDHLPLSAAACTKRAPKLDRALHCLRHLPSRSRPETHSHRLHAHILHIGYIIVPVSKYGYFESF
eukprot:COSAG05_NODE_2053_length_3635_cov_2.811086_2_plen_93_part_00